MAKRKERDLRHVCWIDRDRDCEPVFMATTTLHPGYVVGKNTLSIIIEYASPARRSERAAHIRYSASLKRDEHGNAIHPPRQPRVVPLIDINDRGRFSFGTPRFMYTREDPNGYFNERDFKMDDEIIIDFPYNRLCSDGFNTWPLNVLL